MQLPDYVLVCVCPLAGLSRVSHEHLAVALALEVPVACVVTKADIAPAEAVEQVLQDIGYAPCTPCNSGRFNWRQLRLVQCCVDSTDAKNQTLECFQSVRPDCKA